MSQNTTRTIAELNEDCDILIRREIEKFLIKYATNNALDTSLGSVEISDLARELSLESPEMRQLFFSPKQNKAIEMKERCPKMLRSSSYANNPKTCTMDPKDPRTKRLVDGHAQATDEKYNAVPRSTVLSRTRQHLSKRNSFSQSADVKYKTVKTQTENCSKNNACVAAEPLDFIGMFEKGTNVPVYGDPGVTRNQATQMYEHITPSELFCIEWIHKNLFEVRINPNTLVVDDKLRDHSESPCVT